MGDLDAAGSSFCGTKASNAPGEPQQGAGRAHERTQHASGDDRIATQAAGDDDISQRDIKQATAQASDSATVSASSGDDARGAGRRRVVASRTRQRCDDTAVSNERPSAVPQARPAATSAAAHTSHRQPSAFTLTSAAQAAGVWNPEAQLSLMQRLPTMSSASGSEPAATTGDEPQRLPLSAGPPPATGPPSSPSPAPTASGAGTMRAQHSPPPPGVPQPLPTQCNILHDLTVLEVLTLATARAGQQNLAPLAATSQQPPAPGALPQSHAAAGGLADSPLTALLRAHLLASQHQDAAAAASAMVTTLTDPSTYSAATCAVPAASATAAQAGTPPQTARAAPAVHTIREARGSDPAARLPQPLSAWDAGQLAHDLSAAPAAAPLLPEGAARSGRGVAVPVAAHNLAAPVNDNLLTAAIPQPVATVADAQGAPAAMTLRNSFPNAPSRLHFPERPRTIPALGAAVASRAPDRGSLRATPLTPETRTACAQNLLADRLTYGPQFVPPMPAASADTTSAAAAVPLTSRMSESDSNPAQAPAGGRAAVPVAVPLPQQAEVIETYLKVVAQLAALADGGVYGTWCCAVAEPRCYGGRAIFRKALDLMDVGVRPAHLAPLLREHTAKLQF